MFDFDVLKISEPMDDDAPDDVLGVHVLQLASPVADIPRGPALTLSPETAVATAIEAMRRRARGAAVIVKNHRPIGVVTDHDIVARIDAGRGQTPGDIRDDMRALPVSAVMTACAEPLRESDAVSAALRRMCAQRRWHLPLVCGRGLFVGGLDIADISLWLRDRLTLLSVDAAFDGLSAATT